VTDAAGVVSCGLQEGEIPIMIIECCSQEKTFVRYYALLGARFCMLRREYQVRQLTQPAAAGQRGRGGRQVMLCAAWIYLSVLCTAGTSSCSGLNRHQLSHEGEVM
jgi:hypothetical protein